MTDHIPLSAAETALREYLDARQKHLGTTSDQERIHSVGLPKGDIATLTTTDIRAVLEALDALRGVAGEAWQPIETAPEETEILAFGPKQSGAYLCILKPDGWWCADSHPCEWTELLEPPTHWMPLPEPPTTSQKRGQDHD